MTQTPAIVNQCSYKVARKSKLEWAPVLLRMFRHNPEDKFRTPRHNSRLFINLNMVNKYINSHFDCDLARKGFMYIRDIVSEGEFLNSVTIKNFNIQNKLKI